MRTINNGIMLCASMAMLVGCGPAQAPAARTIEPIEPKMRTGDSDFVLSRKPTKKAAAADDQEQLPIHIAETWWPLRASALGITEAQARERDNAITDKKAP